MNLINLPVKLAAFLLLLASCQSSNCESPGIFNSETIDTCYRLSVEIGVDSVVVISSHTTPENLKTSIGLSYDFDHFADPYLLMLFVSEGTVTRAKFLDCSYYLYDDILQRDGIVVLDADGCYSLVDKDYYTFVTFAL